MLRCFKLQIMLSAYRAFQRAVNLTLVQVKRTSQSVSLVGWLRSVMNQSRGRLELAHSDQRLASSDQNHLWNKLTRVAGSLKLRFWASFLCWANSLREKHHDLTRKRDADSFPVENT